MRRSFSAGFVVLLPAVAHQERQPESDQEREPPESDLGRDGIASGASPSLRTVVSIAAVLGVKPSMLLERVEQHWYAADGSRTDNTTR